MYIMQPAIERIGKDKCTGCYACYSVCPTQAISMSLNDEGFIFPIVNYNICTSCGLCQQVCPISKLTLNNQKSPNVYAAFSNNDEIRYKSSSGGIFFEIAKNILNQEGIVFGAAFNENLELRHDCAETEEQLLKLIGSKYIQSHIEGAYNHAIKELRNNRTVLFCGTPCQVVGLKNLVKQNFKHSSNNLYLCDMICHGVASERAFKNYLRSLSDKVPIHYNFRDKRHGWKKYGSKIVFNDKSEYYNVFFNDPFMIGYIKNIFLRESCFNCPFASLPRQSDMTLGDFWGAPKNLYDKRGVSLVLTNTSQGERLFEKATNIGKHSIKINQAIPYNSRLVEAKLQKPKERHIYFELKDEIKFEQFSKKYLTSQSAYYRYILRVSELIRKSMP